MMKCDDVFFVLVISRKRTAATKANFVRGIRSKDGKAFFKMIYTQIQLVTYKAKRN